MENGLSPEKDVLSLDGITRELGGYSGFFDIELRKSVTSTNTLLKEQADDAEAAAPWKVLIAEEQTAGRGRMGRSFESPEGTGIYLSVLMKPHIPAEKAVRITTAAAVAACRAIEECTAETPSIKWVNDVYVRGKKVCGILTEGSADPATGLLNWAVIGIGFNVYKPKNGFSDAIKDVAGPIIPNTQKNLRNRLSGAFLRAFIGLVDSEESQKTAEEYKKRSFLIGKSINVLRSGSSKPAEVLDIDEECRLVVRYADGAVEALSSGEVSVRQTS